VCGAMSHRAHSCSSSRGESTKKGL
jgi:hypothetical protein